METMNDHLERINKKSIRKTLIKKLYQPLQSVRCVEDLANDSILNTKKF